MTKHVLHAISLLMFAGTALADEASTQAVEVTDTLAAQQLQEVVVEAPKVVRKADMDLYYPSESAVENSKNGVQLLRNLMIPTVNVNEVLSQITSGGESVQLRINGREATIEQVKSLLPETVKRVEWMDNPGLRYNGANTVLNFVVVNPSLGGSLMAQGLQALNCAFSQDMASLKLNNGRSQWGFSANYKLTNKLDTYREYSETFTYPDGNTLTRHETPVGGSLDNTYGSMQLDYSYIKPDTTTLWVALHGYKEWSTSDLYEGIMSQSNGNNDLRLRDYTGNKGFRPTFMAYFEQHFAHNQILAAAMSASLYNGSSTRTYTEHDNVTSELLNDVNTSISDRNQAYSVEADYIKAWSASRLTFGMSYNANRNRSTYENLGGEIFHQRQDRVYFFGEYLQRIRKVTLTAGIGAQYTGFKFSETGQGSNSWNIRPQFTAAYKASNTSQFRLNFTTWQNAPSLSETNIAEQQTDGIQWRVGNPNLKTYSTYMLKLNYNYTLPRVEGMLSVRASTSPHAIAPVLSWRGERLVTSYENSKAMQRLVFLLSPQIEVIPNWVSLEGTLEYRIERATGTDYRLYNHSLNGDVTLMAQHWGFILTAQYQKSQKTLYGEGLSWNENLSIIALTYAWKNWSFSVGGICPFTKYDSGSKSVNRYNSNLYHRRLDMSQMPFVQITYNIQWGRQKRDVQKIVSADANVDTSSAVGRGK
jgi:hypothetical protein